MPTSLPQPPRQPEREPQPFLGPALVRQLGVWAISALAYLLLFGDRWGTRTTVAHLATAKRQALYEARMEAFRLQCVPLEEALATQCRRDAEFLRLFPECDGACRLLLSTFPRTAPFSF
jgi:hypothetical protein